MHDVVRAVEARWPVTSPAVNTADATPPTPDRGLERARIYRRAGRAAWLGLFANLVLGVVKLVAGLVAGSFALLADAFNSLGDGVASGAVLWGLHVAQRPADAEHPYGHSRAESAAAANVAVLIVTGAVLVGWEAARRLNTPHPTPPPAWTLGIAAGNMVIKEVLYHYKMAVARRTGSTALVATAWDHRSDALCSLAVLIGLAVVAFSGPGYAWADEVAALFVVAVVLLMGLKLLRRATSELLDEQATPKLVSEMRDVAGRVPGVIAVETLRVRKTGLEFLADIHIEVDPTLRVAAGHELGHDVKRELMQRFPQLRDVLVHVEPAGVTAGST